MNFKYIVYIALFTSFFLNQLDAGCGSCAADRNKTKKAFIENIPLVVRSMVKHLPHAECVILILGKEIAVYLLR